MLSDALMGPRTLVRHILSHVWCFWKQSGVRASKEASRLELISNLFQEVGRRSTPEQG